MTSRETSSAFLKRQGEDQTKAGQFNVYKVNEVYGPGEHRAVFSRRDFYKISLLVDCEGMLSYGDQVIGLKNNALVFASPMVPYSWKRLSARQVGYYCLFTPDFLGDRFGAGRVNQLSLFDLSASPVLFPSPQSIAVLTGIFEQMLQEIRQPYVGKYELLRSYVHVLLQESLKAYTASDPKTPATAARTLSSLFMTLLESQFPIAGQKHCLKLKSAEQFASQLAVSTNHLNKCLKEVTGKSTTAHLSERILQESKILLSHSKFNVSFIGSSLGFGHPSNFNNFFKKNTGHTPNWFRKQFASSALLLD